MSTQPRFSIITVTYNAESVLEKTIQSVIGQTAFDHIEFIIVDGASKDGTLDIIKKYEDKISKWISEPDKGLYDAMNKGINLATGDYLWFMNAGDLIYTSDTLSKVLSLEPNADIYYGETEEVTENGELLGLRRLSTPEKLTWRSFQKGMLVCHQSIIVKKSVAELYDLQYRLASDIDWVINALRNSKKIVNTHLILSKFAKGGVSSQNIKKGLKERFRIMVKNYGWFRTVFNHLIIAIKFFWFLLLNRRF